MDLTSITKNKGQQLLLILVKNKNNYFDIFKLSSTGPIYTIFN